MNSGRCELTRRDIVRLSFHTPVRDGVRLLQERGVPVALPEVGPFTSAIIDARPEEIRVTRGTVTTWTDHARDVWVFEWSDE